MLKKEIRNQIIQEMKSLDKTEKAEKDLALLEELRASQDYQSAKVIATYLPMPHEYKTGLLIKQALADGKQVVIPKTYPKGKMIFVAYDPKNLERTNFGLLEPKSEDEVAKNQIDLIHVPGVAFNEVGFRIGYGAGYYDRYLADFQGATVSTIYDCQKAEFQEETHDVAVQEVLMK